MVRLAGWQAERLMFVDESAANEGTMDRKFGWAPIGLSAHEIHPAKRSEQWSILPAYTIDGYIIYNIVHGSYNAELFHTFIENKVLSLCSPYPGPRSVLIMDNASIHRSQVYILKIYLLDCELNILRAAAHMQRQRCRTCLPSTILTGF